jgi:hypothetical protein
MMEVGLTPHAGHFTPRIEQVPIAQEAMWDPGAIRMGVEVMTVSYTLNKLDCNVKINMRKLQQEEDCLFHSEPQNRNNKLWAILCQQIYHGHMPK